MLGKQLVNGTEGVVVYRPNTEFLQPALLWQLWWCTGPELCVAGHPVACGRE